MPEFADFKSFGDKQDENLEKRGSKKRPRTASSLDALLKHLRSESNTKAEEKEPEKDKKKGLWRRLVNLFRQSDLPVIPKPELISEGLSETAKDKEIPEYPKSEAEQPDRSELSGNHRQAEFTTKQETAGGELIIDHGEEEETFRTEKPSFRPEHRPADIPIELAAEQHRQTEDPESVGSIVQRMHTNPESTASVSRTQEYLKEQREKRLKRDVRQLKYRSRQQINSQKALAKRQQQLEKQLTEVMEQENTVANQLVQEQTPSLRSVLETTPVASVPKVDMAAESEPRKASTVAPELHPQQFKEFIKPKPELAQAKDVLQRVEIAAKENIPIEQLYERSHEIKDESAKQTSTTRSAMGGAAKHLQDSSKRLGKDLESATSVLRDMASASKPAQLYRNNPELYRESMKMGFWGAMIILLILAIASLVQ